MIAEKGILQYSKFDKFAFFAYVMIVAIIITICKIYANKIRQNDIWVNQCK